MSWTRRSRTPAAYPTGSCTPPFTCPQELRIKLDASLLLRETEAYLRTV